uniref:Parathyroid hormone-like hormone b n=1 Tax=Oreochromis niloticus TaxID=8128 RepID=A0A669F859_ORENI
MGQIVFGTLIFTHLFREIIFARTSTLKSLRFLGGFSLEKKKRSVGHAQLMHDKGRTIHEYTRRMWLHELLEEVHTADDRAPPAQSRTSSQSFSGNHQKPSGATKDLSDRFRQDRVGPNLPQETNKAQAYKESLKVATKRKKKVRLGRRRENDKKRRRARSVLTKAPPRMAI